MAATAQSAIAVIGIDIGKKSFHVVGLDGRGAIVLRQKWSRGQVEARFANMSPCLIGMEACVGAHHFSRIGPYICVNTDRKFWDFGICREVPGGDIRSHTKCEFLHTCRGTGGAIISKAKSNLCAESGGVYQWNRNRRSG